MTYRDKLHFRITLVYTCSLRASWQWHIYTRITFVCCTVYRLASIGRSRRRVGWGGCCVGPCRRSLDGWPAGSLDQQWKPAIIVSLDTYTITPNSLTTRLFFTFLLLKLQLKNVLSQFTSETPTPHSVITSNRSPSSSKSHSSITQLSHLIYLLIPVRLQVYNLYLCLFFSIQRHFFISGKGMPTNWVLWPRSPYIGCCRVNYQTLHID